jgi:DNA polymerase-4
VETDWVRKSIGSETTFSQNLSHPASMLTELSTLATEVLDWMRRHETYGRTLTLKVKYADFQQITRSRTQATPFHTLESMMQTLTDLLWQTEASKHRPVRLLGVSVSKLWNTETGPPPVQHAEQLKLALGA